MNVVITGVPESIRFGVCLTPLSFYLISPLLNHRWLYLTRSIALNLVDWKEWQKRMRWKKRLEKRSVNGELGEKEKKVDDKNTHRRESERITSGRPPSHRFQYLFDMTYVYFITLLFMHWMNGDSIDIPFFLPFFLRLSSHILHYIPLHLLVMMMKRTLQDKQETFW